MPVAQLAQALHPGRRRHDVAALALHRLEEDRRDLGRRHLVAEQRVLEVVERRVLVVAARPVSGSRSLKAYGACSTPGSSGPKPLWYFAFDAVRLTAP